MEVKPGYKQTEVGVIPEEWDAKTIDQVGFVTSGKRLPLGCSLVEHPTPHPYVRVTDMRPGTVSLAEIKFVPESVFPAIKRYRIFCDDIFISVAGTLGIVGKVPKELDGANLTENADRITNITCSQDFLLHVLMSPLIQNTIESIQTVGAQPKLALTRIRKFAIPAPPLPEQRAIATALSDVDALLGALDRLIAKKRDLKQAAMQQLLTGQTRLPGFHGEWSILNISRNASLKARIGWQALTTEEYLASGSHYLVTGTDFIGGRVNWDTCHFVDQWRYNQDQNIQLKNGDVLVTKDGTIGKVGFVEGLTDPATLNSGVFVIRPLQGSFVPAFLFYVLRSRVFDNFIAKITAGSTITHLYQKDFVGFEFLAPGLAEQTAISAVLTDMDAELSALEQRLAKTRALKQGMMQELLTGRTRLI